MTSLESRYGRSLFLAGFGGLVLSSPPRGSSSSSTAQALRQATVRRRMLARPTTPAPEDRVVVEGRPRTGAAVLAGRPQKKHKSVHCGTLTRRKKKKGDRELAPAPAPVPPSGRRPRAFRWFTSLREWDGAHPVKGARRQESGALAACSARVFAGTTLNVVSAFISVTKCLLIRFYIN